MSEVRTTLNDWRDPADMCRERGWGVGTRLIGDEGYGPDIIEITAVGEKNILAKRVGGSRVGDTRENSWVLGCRDWAEVRETSP